MQENDTLIECKYCGKQEDNSIMNLLNNGWTKCCGEAMHLMDTDAKAVSDAVNSMRMRYNQTKKRWEYTSVPQN